MKDIFYTLAVTLFVLIILVVGFLAMRELWLDRQKGPSKKEKEYNKYVSYMNILDEYPEPIDSFKIKELKKINWKLKDAILKFPDILKSKENDV